MINFYNKLFSVIINELIPETEISILKGNKIFSAAILRKKDLSTVTIGTNNEMINPLCHGEISTINNFYNLNLQKKLETSECIFLSSHEPCSLCLSAITWSGFDNFYFFFPYEKTNKDFNIPHDLNILSEIFNIKNGKYNKNNNYWKSYSIIEEVKKLKNKKMLKKITEISNKYTELSNIYQKNKDKNNIPLK